jgi:hypothetical protein
MATKRPSEEVMEQTRRVLRVARERGVDPVVALDDAGLLLHPALRASLIAQAMDNIADLIDEASVKQLVPTGERMPATPLDTKRIIVGWIRSQVAGLKLQP